MQAALSTSKHARKIGRHPRRSANKPQSIGAKCGGIVRLTSTAIQDDNLTNTLQDHVHCNGQVNELDGLVESSSYSGNCWEVYIGCQRTRDIAPFELGIPLRRTSPV